MDTVTHALIGVGLAGLAIGNPEISQNPSVPQALFWATCIGSQGPDFDIVYRLKSKASYYNHHRGLSHSIPTLTLMSLATSLVLKLIFPQAALWTLSFWTIVAALIHVGTDLLTPYNTKILEPLSKKALSWNIMFIIDPFLIIVFSVGIVLWGSTILSSQTIFSFCFVLSGLYLLLRISIFTMVSFNLKAQLTKNFGQKVEKYTLMPRLLPAKWDLVVETDKVIQLGTVSIFPFDLNFNEELIKTSDIFKTKLIMKNSTSPEIEAFIKEAKHLFVEVKTFGEGYWMEWIDLGHRVRNKYPYTAITILDSELETIYIDFGWRQKKIPSWIKEGIN